MSGRTFTDPADKAFEDFQVGDLMVTRGRTVDVGDLTTFAGLTGDHYPLHTDEQAAAGNRFGTRISHGPLTFALAVGLVGMSGFYGDAIVALVEVQSLKALRPVLPGDTVRVHATVTGHGASHNPRHGALTVQYSVRNQRDEEVMTHVQTMLARRRTPLQEGTDG